MKMSLFGNPEGSKPGKSLISGSKIPPPVKDFIIKICFAMPLAKLKIFASGIAEVHTLFPVECMDLAILFLWEVKYITEEILHVIDDDMQDYRVAKVQHFPPFQKSGSSLFNYPILLRRIRSCIPQPVGG